MAPRTDWRPACERQGRRITRSKTGLGLVGLALMVATACGTRVQDAGQSLTPAPVVGTAPASLSSDPLPMAVSETPTESSAPAPGSPPSRRTDGSETAPPPSQGAPSARPAGSALAPAADGRKGSAPPPPAPTPGAVPPPGANVPPASQGTSPVILATVGTFSGPVGSVFSGHLFGSQLWVRYINWNGGLNGRRVELFVYDDGGDPARHRSQVQEAVERRRAIAFLTNTETLTGHASVDYLNAKRVPVVGGDGGETWAHSSPMYFIPMANAESWTKTFVPSVAKPVGKTKLGSLICVEAAYCDDADRAVAQQAKPNGFEHVYRARASLAQPDFTAECLAARNAGVEVFYVIEDQNSLGRLATSCNRQGFRPTYATIGPIAVEAQKDEPLMDGLRSSSNVFPYFQSGTPATDEFQQAFRRYGGGTPPRQGIAVGWTAGKLLEKAARQLPEPPTSGALLAGLWTIRNDTLGGLAPPLTFLENTPTVTPSCWFRITIQDKRWVSPDGYQLQCV